MSWNGHERSAVSRVHQILSVVALAALGSATGSGAAVSAEDSTQKPTSIQCACCSKPNPNSYPPVRCVFLCDKDGPFDRVFFEPRSTALTPAAKEALHKQVICLKRNKFSSLLSAGTDPHEAPNKKAANLLSTNRAMTVKKYFVSKGIPSSSIQTQGWGFLGRATEGRTPEDRRFNRVVTTFPGGFWK